MNLTPTKPSSEQACQRILDAFITDNASSRICMVWDALAAYGVGVGSSAKVTGAGATVNETFAVTPGC